MVPDPSLTGYPRRTDTRGSGPTPVVRCRGYAPLGPSAFWPPHASSRTVFRRRVRRRSSQSVAIRPPFPSRLGPPPARRRVGHPAPAPRRASRDHRSRWAAAGLGRSDCGPRVRLDGGRHRCGVADVPGGHDRSVGRRGTRLAPATPSATQASPTSATRPRPGAIRRGLIDGDRVSLHPMPRPPSRPHAVGRWERQLSAVRDAGRRPRGTPGRPPRVRKP